MQIHRVRGRDLRDALERARRTHGEDAVVLSHEPISGGGVTISVTSTSASSLDPIAETGARDVALRLREAGASTELAREIQVAVAASGANGAFAIDAAATALAACFRAAPSPKPSTNVRVLALVGPTGSGKTTSLAKIGLRLARAGRRVSIATLDTQRPGATELLRAVCSRLGVAFHAIRQRDDLAALVAGERDVVLLDTRGRSPSDRGNLEQLEDVLGECLSGTDVSTYLAVPATTAAEGLDEVLVGFAGTRPEALVVTKLDETRRTAVALEFSRRADLPVAFLCTGQEIGRDLFRATPDRMADLVLGGRIR